MKKQYSLLTIVGLLSCLFPLQAEAQVGRQVEVITCYANDFAETGVVPISPDIMAGISLQLSNFVFTYADSVPTNVRDVVDFAGMIWSTKLASSVPIRVNISWEVNDEPNVLASAGPSTIYRDFSNDAVPQVWYPVALAEAIAGTNLNSQEADIEMSINSTAAWYYNLDGNPPRNRIDMLSVILHELGHGLGFFSSADVQGDTLGTLGFDQLPMVYDTYLANADQAKLDNSQIFLNPSKVLLQEFTSDQVFFASEMAAEFYNNQFPPLYAPDPFELGSSISHLDEKAFPAGTPDALMGPFISFGESVHDLGNVTLSILAQIGWDAQSNTLPTHERVEEVLVSLYPNPANQDVVSEIPVSGSWQHPGLQIFDLSGRLRLTEPLSEGLPHKHTLSTSFLENGAYLVRILANGKTLATKTLLVQH